MKNAKMPAAYDGSVKVGPLRVVEIKQTCNAYPSQWDGKTDDDRQVYARYRWGYLSVRLGLLGNYEEFAAVRGEEIFGRKIGGERDGRLTYDELRAATRGVIEWPNISVEDRP